MVCSNCGCPLTEGFSKFCPECGTPVENNKKSVSDKVFKIIIAIFILASAAWLFFPIIRAGGDKITSLSAFNLIAGKKNFDGMKISAMPYLAPLFILPQILCLIPLFVKKFNIHKTYALIGTFQLYHSVVLVCLWAVGIGISSFSKGLYGYGLGIVINLAASLIIAFLCISFSAAQESLKVSRSESWLITGSQFNLVLQCISLIALVCSFIFLNVFKEQWIFSIVLALSLVCGIIAYYKIMKSEFSQWLLLPAHAVLTLAAHVLLLFASHSIVKGFVGDIDFLDMYSFVSPYINVIIITITAAALIYNVAVSIWAYKTLKRHKRIFKQRMITE